TSSMEKYKLQQRISEKWSVSDIPIEMSYAKQWLEQIFKQLKETQYTNDLYETLLAQLDVSKTYVDFFARLINVLFQQEGLVLIDSHNPKLRRFEKDFFVNIIHAQEDISNGVWSE